MNSVFLNDSIAKKGVKKERFHALAENLGSMD